MSRTPEQASLLSADLSRSQALALLETLTDDLRELEAKSPRSYAPGIKAAKVQLRFRILEMIEA